ncbi:MAG: non-hydrolyzing UDP-N-acetylglucosamine 2-epimerase [Candidatus Heimdallarchaeaceae archaeon]
MKLLTVIGTRPNLVKEYLINKNCKKYGIDEVVVHTGQHYDYNMSKIFLEEFKIKIDHYLGVGSGSHGEQTGKIIQKIENTLIKEQPDATLVYGDVNSTLATAIASSKLKIPIIHYEGGIRTKFIFNPEEINRKVTDCISSLIFTVTKNGVDVLLKENIPYENIVFSGDLHKDMTKTIQKRYNIKCKNEGYIVCTIHRAETTDNTERLRTIIKAILKSNKFFKIPLHPRTSKILSKINLLSKLVNAKNVEILEPLNYIDFVKLLSSAEKVVTDSGGVRREAYILKKPIINLSNIVWFKEILETGFKFVANYEYEKICYGINDFSPKGEFNENIFGDGKAYIKILESIKQRFS